ncbi:MAG: metallophosphoesterase family protein [Cyclobacteriaceae bacterium]
MKIGLLSDTHGYLDESIFYHFDQCDEIWHAGDIGTIELAERLSEFKPFRAVWGNIDGQKLRITYPENDRFEVEGLKVWMTHIGGAPPKYNRQVIGELRSNPPDIFICGHSHILKVMNDKNMCNMLYLNPGAAGRQGFHHVKTLLRFEINNAKVSNMQVIELGKRGK